MLISSKGCSSSLTTNANINWSWHWSSSINNRYIEASNGCLWVGPGRGKFHILQSGLKIKKIGGVAGNGVLVVTFSLYGALKNMPCLSLLCTVRFMCGTMSLRDTVVQCVDKTDESFNAYIHIPECRQCPLVCSHPDQVCQVHQECLSHQHKYQQAVRVHHLVQEVLHRQGLLDQHNLPNHYSPVQYR